MIRALILITSLAAGLALALPARAQNGGSLAAGIERPMLRADVNVNGAVVRIGDLIDNAGDKADIAVFRAPDPGTAGTVPAQAIVEALRAQGVIAVDIQGIEEVRVSRPSNAIGADELKSRIAASLAGRGGLGEAKDLTIRFDGEIAPLEIDPGAREALRLVRATYNPQSTRFTALFIFTPKDAPSLRLRYSGTAQELVPVAVLTRSLERGALVRAGDVTREYKPRNEVLTAYVSPDQAAGMELKRALGAGQMLRDADLMRPELVRRGEAVVIIYRTGGIYLTIRGKAEESGALGEMVAITNLQSKRSVHGVVTGPGEVTVSPAQRVSLRAQSAIHQAALGAPVNPE